MAKKKPETDQELLSFSIPGVAYDELTRLGAAMGINENSAAKLMLLNSLFVRLSQDAAAEEGARRAATELAEAQAGGGGGAPEVQVPVPPPEQPSGSAAVANAARALELATGLKDVVPVEQSGQVALYDREAFGSDTTEPGERFLVVRTPKGVDQDLEAWCGEDELDARSVYEAWLA